MPDVRDDGVHRFAEADVVYRQAFDTYDGTSPFPLAWVCFQLGALWGELVPADLLCDHFPDLDLAALWYRRAIAYLPAYVKARVHFAEVCAGREQTAEGEALLMPVLASRDPESGGGADVLTAQGRFKEAEAHLDAARRGFDGLLAKHLLAFADHAAEFYAGSGNDDRRALELERLNVANRLTRRAVKQQDRKNGPYSCS